LIICFKKVINDIREIISYETVNINIFSDDQIKQLLPTSFGILNQHYQEEIMRIAERNTCIAILAGRVAYNSNCLDFIDDMLQMFDYYRIVYSSSFL